MPSAKTRATKRSTPTGDDPRQLGPIADRMAALLERDTARAERSPAWQAESHPDDWPAAADNFVFTAAS